MTFVSVTQSFNRTTSMGRLTLNILLSFAQFEREVTAERIRDKVAASRKKGMWMSRDDQPDLLSDLSDLDFVRHLLADLHDDLSGKVGRFQMLTDLGGQMGRSGTMIFGGHAAYHAWVEARSSFVHGNYVATILLCQGLVEHLLAAYLHAGLLVDDIPDRIPFADTLRRCREREVISDEDVTDLRRMMALRNPMRSWRIKGRARTCSE